MNKKHCSCGCGKEIKSGSTWAKGHNPNKNKDRFDWSNLEKDYLDLKSIVKVAEVYGCTHEAVHYQMKKRNVKSFDQKFPINDIEGLYEKHKSICKISKSIKCSENTVRERLHKIGYRFTHDNKDLGVEVGLGRYGERLALHLLKGSKDMNISNILSPFDLLWEGKKIDVKVSRPRQPDRGQRQYSFSTKSGICDYYLLIAVDDNDFPRRFFLVPKDKVKTTSVCFTYDFNTRWDEFKMEVNESELVEAVRNAK